MLFLIIYFPLCLHLDKAPIRHWDESRLATNALEMLDTKNPIVTYFDGKPDMWNTKPSLLICIQALFMSIFGVGELAMRLPTAIANICLCFYLLYFFSKQLKKPWIGFIACLVIVTSGGFIDWHTGRTGDYDALLTCFSTVAALHFLSIFLNNDPHQEKKSIQFFFLFLTFATLTKGIAGLLYGPFYFIFALTQKKSLRLLRNKQLYISAVLFIIPVLSYYVIREALNEGYISTMLYEEVFGRSQGGKGFKITGGFWFYYDFLIQHHFTPWYIYVPCGVFIGFFSKDSLLKKTALFLTITTIGFYIVIGSVYSKYPWYDMPMYPMLAIAVGIFFHTVIELLSKLPFFQQQFNTGLVGILIVTLFFAKPYAQTVNRIYSQVEYPWDVEYYEMAAYLKSEYHKGRRFGKWQIAAPLEQYQLINYYVKALNRNGSKLSRKDAFSFSKGDTVLVKDQAFKDYIHTNSNYEIAESIGNIQLYIIK